MNEQKTNYGKIIAVTIAVITASAAIGYVLYRLFRNLISFCNAFKPEEIDDEELDEIEDEETSEKDADDPEADKA